ncbi:MAG: hypothetical protein HYY87_00830 [Candidatus Levybacteria bacterium]|nr:hypothetical protein [Candidatus Levybacteria bacterium]MBI3093061.1 hypothetical protein [Candidatus Levybacteria bacterium]
MKQKYFYSHIVETSIISLELGEIDLAPSERVHLVSLVESQLHHAILDTILSELSEGDKKKFLGHLTFDDHDKIWVHLKGKIENIEEKIKRVAEELKKELHKDIMASLKEAKKSKK